MTAGNPAPEQPAAPGRPGPEPEPLTGWPWLTGGMLALVVGVLWTAQGFDLADDSIMSGKAVFAATGAVLAALGLVLIVMGVRIRGRFRRALVAAEETPAA
ncbi:hypothetical protein [Actinoplanes sp. N902-109]|uniref:hypothetical protein n=1 Tax=Actinoplanes sp. (strain N902-109) TaxID=649831 RepID=UPI00032935EC|nr:hypothetical protein [Actinoplanes sp. N902-109]AGL19600.1 hypothetical protein L083_6090 [Actinoplanes sp. N902-109]